MRGLALKYRLLDLLACPICKTFPLQYWVFNEVRYEKRAVNEPRPYCREYCGLGKDVVSRFKVEQLDCPDCIKREASEGVIKCSKCGRWYPIIEEIPHMLPDDLREGKEMEKDLEFLRHWRDKVPIEILRGGKPYNLASEL